MIGLVCPESKAMHRDALSVALIAESVNAPSRSRRLASMLLISAVRRADARSEEELIHYVEERAPAEVAKEARRLVEEFQIASI